MIDPTTAPWAIIISRAVTIRERQVFEGTLAHANGLTDQLPATHPFRVVPPPQHEVDALSAEARDIVVEADAVLRAPGGES